jgi:hypothetical protein
VIEGAPIMHVNFVFVSEMLDKERDVTGDRTFSSSIRAVVWAIFAVLFMFWLAVVGKYVTTSHTLVFAGEFY